jgi:hypothetical protein
MALYASFGDCLESGSLLTGLARDWNNGHHTQSRKRD